MNWKQAILDAQQVPVLLEPDSPVAAAAAAVELAFVLTTDLTAENSVRKGPKPFVVDHSFHQMD